MYVTLLHVLLSHTYIHTYKQTYIHTYIHTGSKSPTAGDKLLIH